MKFILGTKIGMTQVFKEDGTVVPVTRVSAGPCVVTQIKSQTQDGVDAVELGFGTQKLFRLARPAQGRVKDLAFVPRTLRAVNTKTALKRGDVLSVKNFSEGDMVEVIGTSKGRGFQGVVKRHGFRGGPASHGHKDNLRMPGSIGAGGVQRVFKGMRMGGHMGDDRVTVKNLLVVKVDLENNELLIKGAVPGARGSLIVITSEKGEMSPEVAVVETVATVEAPVQEETQPVVEAEPVAS